MLQENIDQDKLYEVAKSIIEADKKSEEPMSDSDYHDLELAVKKLVDFSVIHLIGGRAGSIFWGNFLFLVPRKIIKDLSAAAAVGLDINGPTLYVNPYIIMDITSSFIQFVDIINHEGFHLLYNHLVVYQPIVKGKDPAMHEAMNIATDAEINQNLKNLPEGCITLEDIKRYSDDNFVVEEKAGSLVYFNAIKEYFEKKAKEDKKAQQQMQKQLEDQMNNGGNSSGDQDGEGDGDGSGQGKPSSDEGQDGSGSGKSNSKYEKDHIVRSYGEEHPTWVLKDVSPEMAKEMSKQYADGALQRMGEKARGEMPGYLKDQIEKLRKPPQVRWTTVLKKMFMYNPKTKKLTKNRLHRQHPDKLYKQGLITGNGQDVYVFIDTSGSMSAKELKAALIECYNIAKQKSVRLYVINVDTEIHQVTEIKKLSDLNGEIYGGGGTQMQPAFDWMHENHKNSKSMIVMMTDAYIENSINNYEFKNVLWVITEGDGSQLDKSIYGKRTVIKPQD